MIFIKLYRDFALNFLLLFILLKTLLDFLTRNSAGDISFIRKFKMLKVYLINHNPIWRYLHSSISEFLQNA